MGQINMKSFLIGCPTIKLGFNEDLTVGTDPIMKGGVMVLVSNNNVFKIVIIVPCT